MIIEQEQAIMTGIALGLESLQSDQYLNEIIGDLQDPLLNDKKVASRTSWSSMTTETSATAYS